MALSVTRDIPALSFRADVVPDSIREESRTVEVIWTTGARVLRQPWFDEAFLEELSLEPDHVRMDFLASGKAPVLDAHRIWGGMAAQIGVVDSAQVDKKRGTATLRFSRREDPVVAGLWKDIQDGIVRNLSVGYTVDKYVRLDPGVDGGDPRYPVYRAVDWTPREISPVPIPADTGAEFRGSPSGAPLNRCTLVREENVTMATSPTKPAPAPVPAPPADSENATRAGEAAAEAAVKTERERGIAIRALVKRHGLDDKMAEDLVAKGTTIGGARAAVLDRLAADTEKVRTDQHVRVDVGAEESEKWMRGADAWLLQKTGCAELVRKAKELKPDHPAFQGVAFDPGEFRGASLVDLARSYLERNGVRVGTAPRPEIVQRAFTHRGSGQGAWDFTHRGMGGAQGTSDFAVLLENALHKVSLAAYLVTPDTWSRFCGTDNLTDFRPHPRYRLGSLGVLDDLTEHGELVNKPLPDGERSTLSLATKGNIIALTRKVIVNDDLGALMRVAMMLGRAGKLTIETAVYALLAQSGGLGPPLGGPPFFDASRNNINAVGSAISVDGIEADANVMAAQKDPSGNEILDLRPAILLVPKSLGGTARVINDAQYDPTDGSANFKPNRVRGLFRDVIDTARLSGTRRYLFADPVVAPAFVVSFLDGQQEPMLRSEEGWRTDGVEWRVILDFGVDPFDFRGAVTNAGA